MKHSSRGGTAAEPIANALSPDEARAIAKEAYIYGFPLVDSYRIQHAYFVDRGNPEYKTGWNTVFNTARVYTPDDKAVQAPNSDTPYSFVGADLRAEPLVISIPPIEKSRFYHVQFVDMYTYNFAYVGSRTTGNGGGNYLLAGPRWNGEQPRGVESVIRSETEFVFVLIRTQLFQPSDLDQVRKVQSGYQAQSLSAFTNRPAPNVDPVSFVRPLSVEDQRTSLEFFNILNFVLQFCPTHASEHSLMERFAKLGIAGGSEFDTHALTPDIRKAIEDGMADAFTAAAEVRAHLTAGKVSSADVFGTRKHLRNNYLHRMVGAMLGIYGNSAEEAIYPTYRTDSSGKPLDGRNHYSIRFAPGQLPPVNAFWSLTMYDAATQLLSENPLRRYLINSPMLPDLKRDEDGGLTLYIQHESPGAERASNWLPAPNAPFYVALRLYWPKPDALSGRWRRPALLRS